ncbi:MAG: hypothetical protein AABY00_01025 [Nanoarchaeota archaeon]
MVFSDLISLFYENNILISFIVGVLSEDLLLLLAIASGGSRADFLTICIFGFLGALVHDAAIYLVAQTSNLRKWIARMERKEEHKPLVRFVERLGRRDYVIPLGISKFIYGTRIALVLHASHKEKRFWRFFFVNTFLIFLWFLVMMPLGWLAGKGFTLFLTAVKGTGKVIGLVVLFVLLCVILNMLFKKILLKLRR